MIVLLVAEIEMTVVFNYEIRTAVRALVHLPVYHLLLGFISFGILIRFLGADTLPPLEDEPLNKRNLAIHICYFLSLNRALSPFYDYTSRLPDEVSAILWIAALLGFSLTWLAALVSPQKWLSQFKAHGPWIGATILLSPLAIFVSEGSIKLWDSMASATLYLSSNMLSVFLSEVYADSQTKVLGTPSFQICIEPGCSGYQGIGLIALYTITYLWLRRKELDFPKAMLLIPIGVTINWLANAVRIAALVLVGTYISPVVAIKGFHSQAGWIAFTLISIFLILLIERGGWLRRDTSVQKADAVEYPASAFVVPLLALLFSRMVSTAFTESFDLYYPFRILVIVCAMLAFTGVYRSLLVRPRSLGLSLGVGLLVYLAWAALVPGEPAETVWHAMDAPWSGLWLAFRIVGSVLVIPLTEELAFRGYLFRRLQSRYFEDVPAGSSTIFALVVSSLAFGLLHGQWIAGTVAGLAFGWVYARDKTLTSAVIAHAVANLCIVVQVLALGHWSLWS